MATTYDVERDGSVVQTGVLSKTFQDQDVPGGVHVYRIRAVNEYGAGEWSEPVEATVESSDPSLLIEEDFDYANGTELSAANPERWTKDDDLSNTDLTVQDGSVSLIADTDSANYLVSYTMDISAASPDHDIRVEVDVENFHADWVGDGEPSALTSLACRVGELGYAQLVNSVDSPASLPSRSSALRVASGNDLVQDVSNEDAPESGTLVFLIAAETLSAAYGAFEGDISREGEMPSPLALEFLLSASAVFGGTSATSSGVTMSAIRVYGTSAS